MSDFEKLDTYFCGDALAQRKRPEDIAKQRREKLLRITKLTLPALAAVSIGLLAVFPSLQNREMELKSQLNRLQISDIEKLHMENTLFYITDKNNRVSNFTSEHIDETEAGSQLVKLTNPEGMMPLGNSNVIYIKSPIGHYDQKSKVLSLSDIVTITYSGGLTGQTAEMFYLTNEGKAYADTPVNADGELGTVSAAGFDYDSGTQLLILRQKSNILLKQKDPLHLLAEEKVELHQAENKIVAFGNAHVYNTSGEIFADRIAADFAKEDNKISHMEADGKVKLKNAAGAIGQGEHFEFDKSRDEMILTGRPARLIDKNSRLSARKQITYHPAGHRAVALGSVVVDDGKNQIHTEKMEIYLQAGTQNVERVEIPQKLKIVTAKGEVTANSGIYYPQKKLVNLYDNVVITQNGNILRGERAETKLDTGISRILSGKSRVNGILYEDNFKSGNKE